MSVRTLLVEDNPGDARLLREMLPRGFQLVHVERLEAAIAAVVEPFDVILLDLTLPDSDGLETFRSLRAVTPDTPILVLTGHDDDFVALQAVREGAQDWLVKNRVNADVLIRALRYAIERNTLEVARRSALRPVTLLPVDLEVCQLIDAALDALQPLATEHGVLIRRKGANVVLRADCERVTQAITNLLANAIHFAAKEVVVTLEGAGDQVSVTVEDDGPGIPTELAQLLLRRFVHGSGSGLGLEIVRGIADLHGGTVRAENREEGGARFVLSLPANLSLEPVS